MHLPFPWNCVFCVIAATRSIGRRVQSRVRGRYIRAIYCWTKGVARNTWEKKHLGTLHGREKRKLSTQNLLIKSHVRVKVFIYQDLSYGEILAGQPEAWLVKKIFFVCMQSQNFKKNLILKFKTISKTCFIFMIALTVYE